MPNTLNKISATSLTSTATSITFSNIPQGFNDLLLKTSLRTDRLGSVEDVLITFNGTSTGSTDYKGIYVYTNGASVAGGTESTNAQIAGAPGDYTQTNIFSNDIIHIGNYSSNTIKSINTLVSYQADWNTTGYVNLINSVWNITSAVTSITITPRNGGLLQPLSTAMLYGIKNS